MTNSAYAEVIGDPVAHSKSPIIHEFWLKKLGMSGAYGRSRVGSGELAQHIESRLADRNWRGCNVTMPLKQIAASCADILSAEVQRIGAANTLVRRHEKLEALNTDYPGFLEPLREIAPDQLVPGKSALIIGGGGAAAAVAAALWDLGIDLVIANRSSAQARLVADRAAGSASAGIRTISLEQLHDLTAGPGFLQPVNLGLLVNASALGMVGKPDVDISLEHLAPAAVVYDLVYDPLETRLLDVACQRGLRCIDGLRMLVSQAAVAFAAFFEVPAPREHDVELRELLTR